LQKRLLIIDFDFPTSVGYYVVVVSTISPTYIQTWYNNDGSPPIHDDCIEAVIFNCTQLSGFTIKGNKKATSVQFQPNTTSALNSLAYAFDSCAGYNYCDLDWSTLGSMTAMYSMFAYSGLLKIDFSALNTPNMTLADSIFSGCKYLTEVIMPSTWYATRYYSMFSNTPRMRKIVLPTVWQPSGTPGDSLSSFFQNCGVEGELEFPSMPWIVNCQNMFYNCPNITVIRLKGNWSALTYVTGFLYNVPLLVTFEAPRILKSTAMVGNIFDTTMTGLKYFLGPDVGYIGMPTNAGLISITGDHDNSGFTLGSQPNLTIPYASKSTVTTVQMPKIRVSGLTVGNNLTYKFTVLTTIEIDWANSSWSYTGALQLLLTAAFATAELERIMTALPSMAKVMDIGNCDGYFTADHTIATAKGWTVRGWCKNVITDAATNIGSTTVTLSGSYGYNGGYTPTSVGVCYAQTANPTTSSPKVTSANVNPFSFNATGLTANKLYYARAYVVTTYGTTYGPQITFTTLP